MKLWIDADAAPLAVKEICYRTAESIGERLSVRSFMEGLRGSGVDTGGHAPYGAREKQFFVNARDRRSAISPLRAKYRW
jgi:uncharacterized protein YaiI (UPF0178 family)